MERNLHRRFLDVVSDFHARMSALLSCEPLQFGKLPVGMATRGVYLFSEQGRHLYVGRSNRLRERYFLHCRRASRQNQASFAYKLARESLDIPEARYSLSGSRTAIAATEPFIVKFDEAKARIRGIEYRFVEEEDQPRQALLEAYCAIVLRTPYNDFDTH